MSLEGKYLKYSPEITPEIFVLIWDKLKSIFPNKKIFDWTRDWSFESFKEYKYISIWGDEDYSFGINNNSGIGNIDETTVQEILGYDPFVKEKVIPEYVEYIKSDDVGKIAKVLKWSAASYCRVEFPNGTIKEPFKHLVKPSTKEAFDAQNKPIEKWSVGSYVVAINNGNARGKLQDKYQIGFIGEITHCFNDDTIGLEFSSNCCNKSDFKWFATKSEAEEFAKTLVEPIKEKVKQPLKQAVHCTTQEEWDFVTEKLGYKWAQHCSFSAFGKSTCISLIDKQYSYVDYLKNDYQILSFQEWCDLNGYKMEKEVKFEVGKWYKYFVNNQMFYMKCDKFENNLFWNNGYIHEGNKEFYKQNLPFDNLEDFQDELSIEEIQQYLPDNHPDKIKRDIKFEVGDWVVSVEKSISYNVNEICRVSKTSKTHLACENKPQDGGYMKPFDKFRHATPEEINNHLISIGQIPAEKYPFKKLEEDDLTWEIKTEGIRWTEPIPITKDNWKHKMILSIDDEELPMVNIIKTNTIKQLLNND